MKIIKKNTRLQVILQAVILFGFALYFTCVVAFGSVYQYVHERHVPMLLLSAAVFLVLGILKLRPGRFMSALLPVFSTDRGYSSAFGFVVFAVALLGMSAASGIAVRFSQFAYTDSLGGQSVIPPVNVPSSSTVVESGVVAPFDTTVSPGITVPSGVESKMQTSDGGIVMNDDNFAQWLTELYTKPDTWIDKKITATGSVWKDGELFEKDEFALARMMMTCCAADMQPVGVLAQWADVQALTEGEWIEVTGTLSKKPYKDSFDPLIIVETIKKINPPRREYIYP
jgi:TIGR03943 family protein